MEKNELIGELEKLGTPPESSDVYPGVEIEFIIPGDNLRTFVTKIYESGFSLLFVSAVHIKPEIAVIYQFVNPEDKVRIRGRVFVGKGNKVDTISDIFTGASWYEREVMEFFGIDFEGNEDKRTLILPEEDKGLNPLLKKEEKLKESEEVGL